MPKASRHSRKEEPCVLSITEVLVPGNASEIAFFHFSHPDISRANPISSLNRTLNNLANLEIKSIKTKDHGVNAVAMFRSTNPPNGGTGEWLQCNAESVQL